MIRRPPRSTQGVSSAASDVYKRQETTWTQLSPHAQFAYHLAHFIYKLRMVSIFLIHTQSLEHSGPTQAEVPRGYLNARKAQGSALGHGDTPGLLMELSPRGRACGRGAERRCLTGLGLSVRGLLANKGNSLLPEKAVPSLICSLGFSACLFCFHPLRRRRVVLGTHKASHL